jgi:glycosyltransferase involved in cell wall biosynthesis
MNDTASRLTLVISSLQSGGAERVMTQMANYWTSKGRLVTLLSFDSADAKPFYPLDPAVQLIGLELLRPSATTVGAIVNTASRALRVRRAIKRSRPDAVVSFLDQVNVLSLLATRGLKVPVIVSERSHPAYCPLNARWAQLRLWTYPWADAVVVQTPEAATFFTNPRVRTTVVPNFIRRTDVRARAYDAGASPLWITAIGRFGPEKGFDMLIAAFARLAERHPAWHLRLIGAGPLDDVLRQQVRAAGLEGRVRFMGRVDNVYPLLGESDLYVMSSRFEGFPNALGEAMATGLPVVSFDCPSGPRALIRHGIDGVLVPPEDVDALTNAIERLIQHPAERAALAGRAIEVADRFAEEAIMKRWDELLERALSRR